MPYYRVHPADEDPQTLLDPGNQRSEPWGGADHGGCDKCGGSGEADHECQSCVGGPADPDCPACRGEVRWRDRCPACLGSGEIDDSSRDGISVFPNADGLYRYMVKRDADLSGCILVELEGPRSGDVDFDADEGALLIKPTRLVDSGPLDWDRIERLKDDQPSDD